MSANQAFFPIAAMARVLGVSKAGYYAWLHRPISGHAMADAALLKRVRTIHASSRQTYGAPRVHADLRGQGERHSRKRIARLMREAGLVGASHRHGGPITTRRDKDARPAPDLVDRDFSAAGPNQLWVADITYVPTAAGFLYLAIVLDAWSRKIVGWSMANHLRTELVLDAMAMAVGQRRPKDVIHHSDQGSQIRQWHSASGVARPAFGPRWDRSVMPMTTPWPRASFPPSRPNSSAAAGSHLKPKLGWPASATSRVGTIRPGCIPVWDTGRQQPTKPTCRPS